MIGLKKGTVKLSTHNARWKKLFEEEKFILSDALGNLALDIQHIGSTSISRILAKPIIDIDVGMKNLKSIRGVEEVFCMLENLGYKWRRQNSNPENYVFVKGSEENRTHYLHLVEFGGTVWKNDLFFRDYLNENSKVAEEYQKLKVLLAKKYPENRKEYTKGKGSFFKKIKRLKNNK